MERGIEFSTPEAAFGGMLRERAGLAAGDGPADG